uniref:Uncharacterized protein n=1 Tax=Oryza punctata TaxID=4537 RepID=A0A0E0LSV5_ORYPU
MVGSAQGRCRQGEGCHFPQSGSRWRQWLLYMSWWRMDKAGVSGSGGSGRPSRVAPLAAEEGRREWHREFGAGDGTVGPADGEGGQCGDGKEVGVAAIGRPVRVGVPQRLAEADWRGRWYNNVHALTEDDLRWNNGAIATDRHGVGGRCKT